jgi:hypothetical protein
VNANLQVIADSVTDRGKHGPQPPPPASDVEGHGYRGPDPAAGTPSSGRHPAEA